MPLRQHRALLASLVASLLTLACGEERTGTLPNPFGAFNFTLESRTPADQVGLLDAYGYEGMVLFWPGEEGFNAFAATQQVRGGTFRMRAVLLDFHFEPDWNRAELDSLLATLAPHGTDLWLILGNPASRHEARVSAVRELTSMATARGVRVVLYPHEGAGVATAEESLALIDAVGLPELQTSLHLCHELKAGHRDRLAEVITAAAPRLALASIHGASRDTSAPGWSTTIMPLDRGDLDVQNQYLLPLARAGYTGPILLHTFGIEESPEAHFRRSLEAWRRMERAVAAELVPATADASVTRQ
ncbi:sugar phosphate isomerase/epimerase family protein [Pyxidicoccus xibeiensis]|uniref:sugar phosphate isomerase/epimerase family protein n=1 Tax=Pyxidicoccus xibeiensis TaxID=2906759 RepID=UPI0020A71DFA|nr:TIM barrel protein [Pyxidicoccus xibeiensis]MCP3140818.1 sugar phosphate isomerase/epimerase [Pyxidicoccus xibeiensis]